MPELFDGDNGNLICDLESNESLNPIFYIVYFVQSVLILVTVLFLIQLCSYLGTLLGILC